MSAGLFTDVRPHGNTLRRAERQAVGPQRLSREQLVIGVPVVIPLASLLFF